MVFTTHTGVNHGLQIGTNSGSVTATFYPQQPEISLSPVSNVPFCRDLDFVGRDIVLDQIDEKCSVPGSRVALAGLGGVGKSQLAIEYSYRIRDNQPSTWVFWIHASNAARYEQSFRDLADQFNILERHTLGVNIFRLVGNWLRDERIGKWVLIFDNVDDDEFLRKPLSIGQEHKINSEGSSSRKPLLAYVPRTANGSVIFTTRNREVASRVVDSNNIVEVLPMNKPDALALLQKKLGSLDESEDALRLVDELELMPLAIVQAASYIKTRAPRCSVSQYLADFQKNHHAIRLLHYEAGQFHRDWEAENSILLTWQMSFNHIRKFRKSATDLLSLMSFFDRQGIPETLLRIPLAEAYQSEQHISGCFNDIPKPRNARMRQVLRAALSSGRDTQVERSCKQQKREIGNLHTKCLSHTHPGDTRQSSTGEALDESFQDDVQTLRDYSFISISRDPQVFEMHRLVQLATWKWLETHGQIEHWKTQSIGILCSIFPNGQIEHWTRCQSLFPHVKSAMSQQPNSESSLLEWAALLFNGAVYAWKTGNWYDMESMASMVLEVRNKLLGPENLQTLNCFSMVGLAYNLMGRWQDAEPVHMSVIDTSRRALGKDHPRTLNSMGNLASTYRKQGRFQDAQALDVQVLEGLKRVLGIEHPHTLIAMANLATACWTRGLWQDAEALNIQVLEGRKRVLGAEHPDTLAGMAQLALTYKKQDRWQDAERLEVEVLDTCRSILGINHPDTLNSMNNLATSYFTLDRWEDAEALLVHVLDAHKASSRKEHPDTLISMGNLAFVYRKQDRWKDAEVLGEQVLEIRRRVLGKDHPDTLVSMGHLALTYQIQGRQQDAEVLEGQMLDFDKNMFTQEHYGTLRNLTSITPIPETIHEYSGCFGLIAVSDNNTNGLLAERDTTGPHSSRPNSRYATDRSNSPVKTSVKIIIFEWFRMVKRNLTSAVHGIYSEDSRSFENERMTYPEVPGECYRNPPLFEMRERYKGSQADRVLSPQVESFTGSIDSANSIQDSSRTPRAGSPGSLLQTSGSPVISNKFEDHSGCDVMEKD